MEEKTTINITLKIETYYLSEFENWLRGNTEVKDFTIVPDTDELYKNDPIYKKMVKQRTKLSREIWNYQSRKK